MKAYPEYKSSGIDWLGEIPSHWNCMPLKYTVKNQETDFIDGNWIESPFITETGVRYLTSGNIGPGFYKEQGNGFISDETFDKLNCIEVLPGDLLISRLNEPIARTCEVPDLGYKIVTCVDNVIYRPISDIFSRRFMMYQLNSEPFWFNASGLSGGATMKRISRSKLGNIKIIVPPLKEQETIAAYLDEVTGKVDALIAEKQEQVEDLRAYRNSIITETVTRGLNPDAPLRHSGIDWLGNIPQHWKILKMKHCIEISNGSDPKTEGQIPVYGSGATSFKTCGEYKDGPTVLIGRKGATLHIPHWIEGKYWNVDTAFDTKVKDNYKLRYFYYIACSFDYEQYKSQTTLPSMTQSSYENAYIPVPPIYEQQQIADSLDQRTEKIDALIDELTKQLDELAEYKKAVISEAVTGKVDVRDWTPKS